MSKVEAPTAVKPHRCKQCGGPNDDAGYSHLCHACLVALEPTPQEQKVAPPVDGQSKSAFTPSNGDTPAVVGLDLDLSPTPLQLECTRLQAENEEQARLLGISGSREAKLLAELERVAGDLNKLRARVESVLWPNSGMAHVTMKGE